MKKSKITAVTSFIFGLIFWIPVLNLIFGVLAIYLGIRALKHIKKDPERYGGKGFAVIGIILGTITIIGLIIGLSLCFSGYIEVCKSIGLGFLV